MMKFIYFPTTPNYYLLMPAKKEKGAYFESSEKSYPDIDLPKWMVNKEEE